MEHSIYQIVKNIISITLIIICLLTDSISVEGLFIVKDNFVSSSIGDWLAVFPFLLSVVFEEGVKENEGSISAKKSSSGLFTLGVATMSGMRNSLPMPKDGQQR